MLNFEFTRERNSDEIEILSLHASNPDYAVHYTFKPGQAQAAIAPHILSPILALIKDVPDEQGIFRFPEFSVSGMGLVLSGAQVFQNTSTLRNTRATFSTELAAGSVSQVLIRESEHVRLELNRPRKTIDFLLRSMIYLMDRNELQLERLGDVMDGKEITALQERNLEILSFMKDMTRVVDDARALDDAFPAGLSSQLAKLSLDQFEARLTHQSDT